MPAGHLAPVGELVAVEASVKQLPEVEEAVSGPLAHSGLGVVAGASEHQPPELAPAGRKSNILRIVLSLA